MRHKFTKITLGLILLVALILIGLRAYLPYWVRDYVNKEINNLEGYSGAVADIDIHLWRGAYQLHNLDIRKDKGGFPIPFVRVDTADISVEWQALFQGAVVAEIDLYNAQLNFAVGRHGQQQGADDAGWARFVDALSPLEINRFTVNGGKLTFTDFTIAGQSQLFIEDIALRVENLKAVQDKNSALPSPVSLSGRSIGGGKLNATGHMNILKDIPDFNYDIKLEGANLTAMNKFARARIGVDFEAGDLSLYSEIAAKNGRITGYLKPVARNVEMVDLKQDGGPFSIIWQSIVSVFAEIFKNHPEDQLATRIPIEGRLNNPETSTWEALIGIFKNTFNAYLRDTDNLIDFSHTQRKNATP
ncbi:MAG TPA: DUF748 domain-containing protein [Micavibrio sp.]